MDGSAHSYLKTMSGEKIGKEIYRLTLERGITARQAADHLDKYGPGIPTVPTNNVDTNGWKPIF